MDINYCIDNISNDKIIGSGFEKNCYDFGDVVLLESRFLNDYQIYEEVRNVFKVKSILDGTNINSYNIYDYKVVFNRLYILENKVEGTPLQDVSNFNDSSIYINRLKELDKFYILKKFVIDYITILCSGLSVDPSSPNNFLFDGESIHFIDLGLSNSMDKKYICFYILHNIINSYCNFSSDDIDIISFYIYDIYNKLRSIYVSLGYTSDMYSFSPNGKMCDYIDRKINNFKVKTKSI